MSPEEFAGQVLSHELRESAAEPFPQQQEQGPNPKPPIWEVIAERAQALPSDIFDRLREDGARQHDHYIYGLPKREQ